MRFTNAAIFTTILAVVSASPASSVSVDPISQCVSKCPNNANWSTCAAKCEHVPYPNSMQVEADRKCVAQCPQGNGSPKETQEYYACMNECAKAHYFTGGLPTTTGGPTYVAASTDVSTTSNTEATKTPANSKQGGGSSSSKPTGSSKPSGMNTSKMTGKGPMPTGGMKGNGTGPSGPGGAKSTSSGNAGAIGATVGGPVVTLAGLFLALFAL